MASEIVRRMARALADGDPDFESLARTSLTELDEQIRQHQEEARLISMMLAHADKPVSRRPSGGTGHDTPRDTAGAPPMPSVTGVTESELHAIRGIIDTALAEDRGVSFEVVYDRVMRAGIQLDGRITYPRAVVASMLARRRGKGSVKR